MNKIEASSIPLEILVSTMNRNSLDFLNMMFQNNDISEYQILVINQTSGGTILQSDRANIRVINSFGKGLSKSRNLALDNAIGDVCLLADDDVVYLQDFQKVILESYTILKNADIVTLKTLTTDNKPYYDYPKDASKLKGFSKYVLSIEISFKRQSILESGIRFNEQFGLGATFEDSENYIFLKDIIKKKTLHLYFVPRFVVIHPPNSSSNDIVSDRLVLARSALNYHWYGNLAYFYILKLVFYLLRNNLIRFDEAFHKFKVGHRAINTYKLLNKN